MSFGAHALMRAPRFAALTAVVSCVCLFALSCSESTAPTRPSSVPVAPDGALTRVERDWLDRKGTIQVGAFNDYPPFGFVDANGKAVGMAVDFWNLVATRLSVKVVFTPVAFADQLAGLRQGRFDSLQGIFPVTERTQWFAFTTPYFDIDTRIYVGAAYTDRTTLGSLKGLTVAVVAGDSGQHIAADAALTTLVVKGYPDAVAAVATGKAQAMILDQLVADYFIAQARVSAAVKVVGAAVDAGQMTMPVRKDDVVLLGLLNKGIGWVGEGEFKAIYNKWMGQP
jgi:ABC-type amino acid transport substrate-binding protein